MPYAVVVAAARRTIGDAVHRDWPPPNRCWAEAAGSTSDPPRLDVGFTAMDLAATLGGPPTAFSMARPAVAAAVLQVDSAVALTLRRDSRTGGGIGT